MNEVYLVLDADRQVIDVCSNERTAAELAAGMGATYERWPITTSVSDRAWRDALQRSFR
jgi:hypothetical protein